MGFEFIKASDVEWVKDAAGTLWLKRELPEILGTPTLKQQIIAAEKLGFRYGPTRDADSSGEIEADEDDSDDIEAEDIEWDQRITGVGNPFLDFSDLGDGDDD